MKTEPLDFDFKIHKPIYVTIKQAMALKNLGFNWGVTHYYTYRDTKYQLFSTIAPNNWNLNIPEYTKAFNAPNHTEVIAWFRTKGIYISISTKGITRPYTKNKFMFSGEIKTRDEHLISYRGRNSYGKAEIDIITLAINFLSKQNGKN
jgi:hypothetical protein